MVYRDSLENYWVLKSPVSSNLTPSATSYVKLTGHYSGPIQWRLISTLERTHGREANIGLSHLFAKQNRTLKPGAGSSPASSAIFLVVSYKGIMVACHVTHRISIIRTTANLRIWKRGLTGLGICLLSRIMWVRVPPFLPIYFQPKGCRTDNTICPI